MAPASASGGRVSPEQRSYLRAAIDTRQRELHGKPAWPEPVTICAALKTNGGDRCKLRARPGSIYCGTHIAATASKRDRRWYLSRGLT